MISVLCRPPVTENTPRRVAGKLLFEIKINSNSYNFCFCVEGEYIHINIYKYKLGAIRAPLGFVHNFWQSLSQPLYKK